MNVHVSASARSPAIREPHHSFAQDVIAGLSHQPKRLSPKYFYDEAGSKLFERITMLPEYYPTRTELGILRDRACEIAAIPSGAALVEFGAGATTKVRLLLKQCAFKAPMCRSTFQAIFSTARPAHCAGISPISQSIRLPRISPPFELPDEVRDMPKVGFFPGSTIGNFDPHEASAFLRSAPRYSRRRRAW